MLEQIKEILKEALIKTYDGNALLLENQLVSVSEIKAKIPAIAEKIVEEFNSRGILIVDYKEKTDEFNLNK